MRLIDADALKEKTIGHGEKTAYVVSFLWDVDASPTIDAIPVEWLKQQYQKCEEIKNKIPITLQPNIHDVAVGLKCTELIGAIDIVLNLYAGWKKEQEAR